MEMALHRPVVELGAVPSRTVGDSFDKRDAEASTTLKTE